MSEKIVQRNEEDIKGASATGARQRCHSAILTGILPFLLRLPLGMNSPFVIRILCNKWGAVQYKAVGFSVISHPREKQQAVL